MLRLGLHLEAPLPARLLGRDGTVRHVVLRPCDPMPGLESAVALGVEDMDPARERDAALLRAQELQAALCEHMFDNLMVLDRHGRVLEANASGRRDLPRDPLGRILWEVYPAAVGGRFWKHVQEVMATGAVIEDEHLSPELGGWLGYRLAPFGGGVLCVCRHLDQIHHLRTLLQDLGERVDLAVAGGRMALWQLDLRSDRVWLSDDARDLLGSGQMTRKALLDRVRDEDRGAVRRAIETAVETRGPFESEFRYRGGDRPERRLRMRGAFVPASLDRPSRLAGIALKMDADMAADRDDGAGFQGSTTQSARDLTGAQVRAARGLLRWSVRELAERSQVSVATINRVETGDGVPSARGANLVALHAALGAAGARFLRTAEQEPAVALVSRPDRQWVGAPGEAVDERSAA